MVITKCDKYDDSLVTDLQSIYTSQELYEIRELVQDKTGVSLGEVLLCKNYMHETVPNAYVDRLSLKIMRTMLNGAKDYYDLLKIGQASHTGLVIGGEAFIKLFTFKEVETSPPKGAAASGSLFAKALTLEETAEYLSLSTDDVLLCLQSGELAGSILRCNLFTYEKEEKSTANGESPRVLLNSS